MLPTTHWSLVVAARGKDSAARSALAQLCQNYRGAVLAYARRHSRTPEEAEDLTQAFFVEFLEHEVHASADPSRGRFRTYLYAALSHFIAHVREHEGAQKRGGGQRFVALDTVGDDSLADSEGGTPEEVFERAWAYAALEQALEQLGREQAQAGRSLIFLRLREFLLEPPAPAAYNAVARELGLRANTVAVCVHRLRERLRELVRIELGRTVADTAALDEEVRAMREALQPP